MQSHILPEYKLSGFLSGDEKVLNLYSLIKFKDQFQVIIIFLILIECVYKNIFLDSKSVLMSNVLIPVN